MPVRSSKLQINMASAVAGSSIARFFENKAVFLTGVTGSVGKAILLKLLRSCPGTSNIYVLIREEKGQKLAADRLKDILYAEHFQNFLGGKADSVEKVKAVKGNVTESHLGIRPDDEERLRNEVSVVIHAAASVRFDEPIKNAMRTNVHGVHQMLELAKKMKKLESFVHISAAYSNCNRPKTEEKVYPNFLDPMTAMELFENLSEEKATAVYPLLLEGRPNTYTLTKSIAEELVHSYRDAIPLGIVRPSLVVAAESDPVPGWIDSWNTATQVFRGMLYGYHRVFHVGSPHCDLHLIPMDHTVNLTIAAAWYTATAPKMGRVPHFVYNCCSGGKNPLKMAQGIELVQKAAWKTPFSTTPRYPSVTLVTNNSLYKLGDWLCHRLPCELMDLKAKIFGQKPRFMKTYHQMCKVLDLLSFFALNVFNFPNENAAKLYEELSEADKKVFNFDTNAIRWEPFINDYIAGVRRFLLREPDAELASARDRYKRLYMVHWMARVLGVSLAAAGILVPLSIMIN